MKKKKEIKEEDLKKVNGGTEETAGDENKNVNVEPIPDTENGVVQKIHT